MSFTHACFISYRDSDNRNTQQFLEQFCEALSSYLDQRLSCKLCIDIERLKPGFKYNVAIAKDMRESVCLLAVLSPTYFESEYCQREYVFMQQLEEVRRLHTGVPPVTHSLVIPLLVWGEEKQVPEEIRGHTQLTRLPFGLINLKQQRIDEDPNLIPVLEQVGAVICELHGYFSQAGHCATAVSCCNDVDFPDSASISPWQINRAPTQPFVGRSNQGGA